MRAQRRSIDAGQPVHTTLISPRDFSRERRGSASTQLSGTFGEHQQVLGDLVGNMAPIVCQDLVNGLTQCIFAAMLNLCENSRRESLGALSENKDHFCAQKRSYGLQT